jgi:hypothetical protein
MLIRTLYKFHSSRSSSTLLTTVKRGGFMKKLAILMLAMVILAGCAPREIRPDGVSTFQHQIDTQDCIKRAGGLTLSSTPTGQKIYRECMEQKGYGFTDN